MDYPLAISSDLRIDAEEFAAVWNQDPTSRGIAQAMLAEATSEKYVGLDPELIRQGLVFLAGVAGTVALDVIKDQVKDLIKRILAGRSGSSTSQSVEVILIQTGDKPVILVKSN